MVHMDVMDTWVVAVCAQPALMQRMHVCHMMHFSLT